MAEIIDTYVEKYDASTMQSAAAADCGIFHPRTALAVDAGVPEDTLYRAITGRLKSLDISVVDRILCALDRVYLWYEPPLAAFYDGTAQSASGGGARKPDLPAPLWPEGATCRNGHERTLANTLLRANGMLRCRDCNNIRSARYRATHPRGRAATC